MTDAARLGLQGRFGHSHEHGTAPSSHETATRWVVGLTFATMIAELVVGSATHSLALTADGWHMATHAGALGMAALAYRFARVRSASTEFSFGTGKVHALAGHTSAVVLALVAIAMIAESIRRLVRPESIAYEDALPVAILGLVVNLASVKLLHADEHHDEHGHGGHGHGDHGHAHDHNLRAAYFHVLADALTSVLAILALLGGRAFGWTFLDPAMGIVGGVVIARWSYGLCRAAAAQLLDVVPSTSLVRAIRERMETAFPDDVVVDLHLWDLGPAARACIVSIASPAPRTPTKYREVVNAVATMQHVTIEVHPVRDRDSSDR